MNVNKSIQQICSMLAVRSKQVKTSNNNRSCSGAEQRINPGHLGSATVLPPGGALAEHRQNRAFNLVQHDEGSVEKKSQEEGAN